VKYFLAVILIWPFAGNFATAQIPHSAAPTFEVVGAPQQFPLVNGLREISGLAAASKNSVYAHNDEHSIVYEINLRDGAMTTAFALGNPTASADFEGIAVKDGRIYLASSNGLLYEGLIGEHRKRVRYNIYDTGVGAFCEVEGLANAPEDGAFLMLCKTAKFRELKGRLVIFRWSVRDRIPVVEPWLNIPYDDFLSSQDARIFRPSALEWDDERKALIILSARSHKLIVVSQAGRLLYEMDLPENLHAQPEGVLLTSKGDIIIADEGTGRRPGMLSVYKLRR